MLHWLIRTDGGLATRLAIGLCIFAILAIADITRNGPRATRWREYAFLAAAAVAAMIYGALNDQITSRISWEYFYYGKELDKILGPNVPPDPARLHLQAAKVGIEASWTVGLICGVILLLANNPSRTLPRLQNRRLLGYLPLVMLVAAGFGVVFGILGYLGYLDNWSPDFEEMVRANLFHPRRFICVWGVHLGGYVGGAVGTALAVMFVRRKRRVSANFLIAVK